MESKQAFTLIELLIGIALSAIVILILGYIFISHLHLFQDENTAIELTDSNKIALDEITNQIRESQSVADNCTPCGSTVSDSDSIILQLWPLNASGEPYSGSPNYDYIVYKLDDSDNTTLTKNIYPHANSTRASVSDILSRDVSTLTLTYNNATPSLATEVTIRLKNSKTVVNKPQEVDRESKAVLRNK